MCRRDSAGSGGAESNDAPLRAAPDLRCAMDVADVAASLGRADVVLVDVRPSDRFEAGHVEGAVNMTASALRTKAHLQAKHVIVVGSGKADHELYAACAELTQAGFRRVGVLRGGMAAWVSQGHPAVGDGREALIDATLSASELWAESRFEGNVVVATPDRRDVQQTLGFAKPIAEASMVAVQSVLERRRKELKGAPLASVILVSGTARDEGSLQRLRAQMQPIPVLAYHGSASDVEQVVRQQDAVWRAHARGPKAPRCGT
jgi:rhodanese-related sulfurtransferase